MRHPDEGTIQGWLEGQLPAGEGREVAAHVATCAECQALAAEIRGLMARTSGIVAALDGEGAVRPAVVPGSAAASPAASSPPARRRPVALRRWAPALAAAAVVLVVMRQASSRDDVERPADAAAPAHVPVAVPPQHPVPEIQGGTAAAPAESPAAVAGVRVGTAAGDQHVRRPVAQRGATDLASRRQAPSPLADEAVREGAGSVARAPLAEGAGLPAPVPAPVPAPAPPMVAAAAPTSSAGQAPAAASAPAPLAAPVPVPSAAAASQFRMGRMAAKAQRVAEDAPMANNAINVTFTGCYRVISQHFSKMLLEPAGRALVVDADTTVGRWSPAGDSIVVRWQDSVAVFPAGVARTIGRYGVPGGETRPLTVWRGCPGS